MCSAVLALLSTPLARLRAQDPERPIVVTATRGAVDPFELPYATHVLAGELLTFERQPRSFPEALRDLPGVSVQKTAHGQGSPKIRGQNGFRTLLLIDGVRVNDSTWRPGNVEYWNHLDPFAIDRVEIVRGPGSVLWGSDAVAGTAQVFTRGRDEFLPGLHADGRIVFRYASAEDSFSYRTETSGNADDFGWHLGLGYRDYGDLRAGRDVGLMPETGYLARDADGKLAWRIDDQQRLEFGYQLAHLDDVPRTHSTVNNPLWRGLTPGGDLKRDTDHQRQWFVLRWSARDALWCDELAATASYKDRSEDETRIRGDGRVNLSELDVSTLGFNVQAVDRCGDATITYGADWYHDFVDSAAIDLDSSGNVTATRARGVVAGDASYDLAGLFAQLDTPLGDSAFDLIAGVRWTYAQAIARRVDVPGDSVTVDAVDDDWNAVTGSLRLLHRTAEHVRTFAGVSQAFRAPNLSDLTRFDAARTGEIEVPSTDLDPEESVTFELGARYDDGSTHGAITAFHTLVRDQIDRFRTGAVIDGASVVEKANVGDGWWAGFELEGGIRLSVLGGGEPSDLDAWSVFGAFDWIDGRIDQIDASGAEFEDRHGATPPPSGMVGVRWEQEDRDVGAEAFVRFARPVSNARYTPGDRANSSRIPPDGLPGYAVVGLRGWAELGHGVRGSLAVENLGDVDYRIMDSGLMEPGTNVIATVEARF